MEQRTPQTWIISRHKGAIEWIKSKGLDGTVIEQFDGIVVPGDLYVGTLPLPLIAAVLEDGANFILLVLPNLPREARGKELTPEMMGEFGARLLRVKRVELEEI